MSLLYGVASVWREIALGLGFDQDHLEDEIFVNSETDEARLQDCVEQWVAKLGPSWEQLSLVLRDLGQESLAQQACSGGVLLTPLSLSLSGDGETGMLCVVCFASVYSPTTPICW